jgi:hypothetical protein
MQTLCLSVQEYETHTEVQPAKPYKSVTNSSSGTKNTLYNLLQWVRLTAKKIIVTG